MLEALFGTEMPLAVRFFIAFVIVLALMGALVYGVRRFGPTALNAAVSARGRQPRLGVIEAAAVGDGRRRLLLIRRDNVEHLIMIGGPSDVVIEPNIVRAIPTTPVREAPPARVTDTLPRAVPLAEGGGMWPLQPEPPPRQQRMTPPPPPPPAAEEDDEEQEAEADWSPPPEPAPPPEPPPRPEPERAPARAPRMQNTDRLAGLAVDLSRNFMEPETAPPPRRAVEPRRSAPAPAPAPLQPVSDTEEQNLAEMAHRLETALHRPRQGGEPAPAVAPPVPRMADPPRVDSPRAEPKPAARAEPPPLPVPAARPAQKPKAGFDNLEQEMASLLGRPSGKI
jgi:flagellar protein FliO/FliZ